MTVPSCRVSLEAAHQDGRPYASAKSRVSQSDQPINWLVPGLHAWPQTRVEGGDYVKTHGNPAQFETEVRLRTIACAAGCSPDFAVEEPLSLRTRALTRLAEWLPRASDEECDRMALRILRQVLALHEAGVCHRDLKVGDVVLDGDHPLLIDFDLGTAVAPSQVCFDLYGPASGVPVAPIHLAVGIADGVWWDSRDLQGLSAVFGPLSSYSGRFGRLTRHPQG